MATKNVAEWTNEDVIQWLEESGHSRFKQDFFTHSIDGRALLTLAEEDVRPGIMSVTTIGDIKRLYISIKLLQRDNITTLYELGHIDLFPSTNYYSHQRAEVSNMLLGA